MRYESDSVFNVRMKPLIVAVSVRVSEEQRRLLQTPALRLSSAGGESLSLLSVLLSSRRIGVFDDDDVTGHMFPVLSRTAVPTVALSSPPPRTASTTRPNSW